MDFGAPSHAVGFDTYLNNVDGSGSVAPPEAVIEIFDTSNGLIDTYTLTHNHTVVGFFGVVTDQAIGAIRWTTTGGEFMNTGVTNIQQGMPIPAPGRVRPGTPDAIPKFSSIFVNWLIYIRAASAENMFDTTESCFGPAPPLALAPLPTTKSIVEAF